MKKRIASVMMVIVLLLSTFSFATIVPDDVKYGNPLVYSLGEEYDGEITIDGLYVYKDKEEYIFTVLYSNGQLIENEHEGVMRAKTSFFNPPNYTVIEINWFKNFERVTSDDKKVQYRVPISYFDTSKNDFDGENSVTVLLYDAATGLTEEMISFNFKFDQFTSNELQTSNDVKNGYEIKDEAISQESELQASSWALKSIEELKLENILKDEVFSNFSEGITRESFVYLMVELYEELTQETITVNEEIFFNDSDAIHVLKAASIGITSGIGNDLFGPEKIINREQMATFIIKTLSLAGVELESTTSDIPFSDDEEISSWAKSSTYLAKNNGFISGVGNNRFNAKGQATNEQALYITHKLLSSYGNLKWYSEYDKNRLVIRYDNNLYQVDLDDNILIVDKEDSSEILFQSLEDINSFLKILHMDQDSLKYDPVDNPNIKGNLILSDANYVKMNIKNMYSGIDKVGEHSTIDIDTLKAYAEVKERTDITSTSYTNFDHVKYYDLNNERKEMDTLSIVDICEKLELTYSLSYNKGWDILVFEVTQ